MQCHARTFLGGLLQHSRSSADSDRASSVKEGKLGWQAQAGCSPGLNNYKKKGLDLVAQWVQH